MTTTLVLWDIDHTLISIGGLSGEIYRRTFEQVTGRSIRELADMTGATDLAIITATLQLHEIEPTRELVTEFARQLGGAFDACRAEVAVRGHVLPGARAALDALAAHETVLQSVLTGNAAPIARCKLAAFHLERFFDLEVGAYGMDDTTRPPMVRLARRRLQQLRGITTDAAHTVLIGDTPKDVEAGHEGGARVVAVATGSSTVADLRAAGAELVLDDLADTNAVVRAVIDVSGP
ncbi:HAD family hydrolase [Actinomadura monticuli]|uniref:Haloacid dehalogenase-like hydrolase n=1 Tax=Actinomadura monticuli TaxID=3097367 RepID=A0ABV4Q5U7_9ACTN